MQFEWLVMLKDLHEFLKATFNFFMLFWTFPQHTGTLDSTLQYILQKVTQFEHLLVLQFKLF